ncbi:hypothetical protein EIP91_000703 [Steccherinum ochraceum]|uniref:Uncharacterized protein n=1 Tax=Steccherinum ochraceum TaxID=92696 RepID=A0A4R0RVY2_9APHY|nr:hypothetical protein EIP91_000703 [Steccherinum ochraceum]
MADVMVWLGSPFTDPSISVWYPCLSEQHLFYDVYRAPQKVQRNINSLPPEILREIIYYAVGSLSVCSLDDSLYLALHDALTTICLVCTLWRDISYASGPLWATINLAYPVIAASRLSHSSRSLPLNLSGTVGGSLAHSGRPFNPLLLELKSRSDQITSIRLHASTPLTLDACSSLFRASFFFSLTDLFLVSTNQVGSGSYLELPTLPALKRLHLEDLKLSFQEHDVLDVSFPSLEELEFIGAYPSLHRVARVLKIVRRAPQLRSLKLHFNITQLSQPGQPSIVLPSDVRIILFQLDEVLLYNVPSNLTSMVRNAIDAPALKSYDVQFSNPWSLMMFLHKQQENRRHIMQDFRSCQCELELVHHSFPSPQLTEYLKLASFSKACHCSSLTTELHGIFKCGLKTLHEYLFRLSDVDLITPCLFNLRITHVTLCASSFSPQHESRELQWLSILDYLPALTTLSLQDVLVQKSVFLHDLVNVLAHHPDFSPELCKLQISFAAEEDVENRFLLSYTYGGMFLPLAKDREKLLQITIHGAKPFMRDDALLQDFRRDLDDVLSRRSIYKAQVLADRTEQRQIHEADGYKLNFSSNV